MKAPQFSLRTLLVSIMVLAVLLTTWSYIGRHLGFGIQYGQIFSHVYVSWDHREVGYFSSSGCYYRGEPEEELDEQGRP